MRTIVLQTLFLGTFSIATAQNQIALDLTTDQYGSETLWQFDGMNVGFFQNGNGGEDQASPGSYPHPTQFIDLPDGRFNFCLGDAYDDGFCCAFGQGSLTLTHVASGTVLFHTDTFSTSTICIQFEVPLGHLHGQSFLDDDHDCNAGASEPVLPGQVVRVLPGPYYAITDSLGYFDLHLPNGNYDAEVVTAGLSPICPPTRPVPFTITDAEPFAELSLGDSSTAKLDIVAVASIGIVRAGGQIQHTIQVSNASAFMSGPVTVTAELDPLMSFTNASITPSSIVANTLTWDLPALQPFTQDVIHLQAHLPPPQLLGTPVSLAVEALQTLDEIVLVNNTFTAHGTVIGSYDPNDKVVWPRNFYDLSVDSVLDYVIHFQNTGTDTAFNIVVTDTLATELDMSTFEAGAASHPCTITFEAGRVVEWRFANVLLPDSTVDEPASHGMVGFRIRPMPPVSPGTIFSNTANIYFDYNQPVITEPSVVVAELNTSVDERLANGPSLYPNPASDVLNVFTAEGRSPIAVLTIDGRSVQVSSTKRVGGFQLDVHALPVGLYCVRTDNGTARFVKQ